MTKLIVLFKLIDEQRRPEYEAWARSTDLPIVRGLSSVTGFEVHRAEGLLGSDERPPYDYVEIIDIGSLDRFGEEVATDTMQQVASEFRGFAANPVFILTGNLEGEAS